MSLATIILRGLVKLADDAKSALTLQLDTLEAGDPDDEVECFEPVGVHFLPSLDDEMLVLQVSDDPTHTVALGATQRGHRPRDLDAAGTGGLHYLGAWKVFLDDDGTLHLGKRDPSDFVALASRVLDELEAVKTDLDGFKSKYDVHTHAYNPGPGAAAASGAPAVAFPTPHTPASVASEIVRVE